MTTPTPATFEADRLQVTPIYGDRVRLHRVDTRRRSFAPGRSAYTHAEHHGPAWRVRAEWSMAVRLADVDPEGELPEAEVDARLAERPYDTRFEETWWATREAAEAAARAELDAADPIATGELSPTDPCAHCVRRGPTSVAWHSGPDAEHLWRQTAEVEEVDPPRPRRYTVALVRDAMSDEEAEVLLRPRLGEDPSPERVAKLRARYCGAQRVPQASSDDRDLLAPEIEHATRRAVSSGGGCFGYRVEVEAADATPVHVHPGTYGWCLWSDSVLTTRGRVSEAAATKPSELSAFAAKLIGEVVGSDSGAPTMGWRRLAEMLADPERSVSLDVVVEAGPTGPWGYQGAKTRLLQTHSGEVWVWTCGYSEGYQCIVTGSRAELDEQLEALRGPR